MFNTLCLYMMLNSLRMCAFVGWKQWYCHIEYALLVWWIYNMDFLTIEFHLFMNMNVVWNGNPSSMLNVNIMWWTSNELEFRLGFDDYGMFIFLLVINCEYVWCVVCHPTERNDRLWSYLLRSFGLKIPILHDFEPIPSESKSICINGTRLLLMSLLNRGKS